MVWDGKSDAEVEGVKWIDVVERLRLKSAWVVITVARRPKWDELRRRWSQEVPKTTVLQEQSFKKNRTKFWKAKSKPTEKKCRVCWWGRPRTKSPTDPQDMSIYCAIHPLTTSSHLVSSTNFSPHSITTLARLKIELISVLRVVNLFLFLTFDHFPIPLLTSWPRRVTHD